LGDRIKNPAPIERYAFFTQGVKRQENAYIKEQLARRIKALSVLEGFMRVV
jgi:hypothetical protein